VFVGLRGGQSAGAVQTDHTIIEHTFNIRSTGDAPAPFRRATANRQHQSNSDNTASQSCGLTVAHTSVPMLATRGHSRPPRSLRVTQRGVEIGNRAAALCTVFALARICPPYRLRIVRNVRSCHRISSCPRNWL
jgi:hypothetical protein